MTKVRGIYCLKKDEIIRGYNSFKKILTDSKILSNDFFRINIQVKERITENKEDPIYKDPLANVKVGFIVSKRIVKKASLRNRLKRLARESYRQNKYLFVINNSFAVYVLISYSEYILKPYKELKFDEVNDNMRAILIKAIEYLKKFN